MWPRLVNVALGVWLTAAPSLLGYADDRAALVNDQTVGPLVTSMAITAVWQVMRPVRWVNAALGAWLLLAPLVFGFPLPAAINSVVVGTIVIAIALVRGPEPLRMGGGWAAALRAPPWERELLEDRSGPRPEPEGKA